MKGVWKMKKNEISRRDFLKGAAAGAVAVAAGGLLGCSSADETTAVAETSPEAATAAETLAATTAAAESESAGGEGGPGGPGASGGAADFDISTVGAWRKAPEAVTQFAGEFEADVVIVGGGQAGAAAARAAAEAGASVIVLEMQEQDKMMFKGGGQIGHINSEFLKSRGVPEVDIIEFVTDWQLRTNNRSRAGLIMKYAKNSGKCFDWLTDSYTEEEKAEWSVRQWPLSENYTQKKNGISTWVGTPTLNDRNMKEIPIQRAMLKSIELGADWHYGVKAAQLIKEGNAITGVVGQAADGTYQRFTARKGVILSGGGFGGNPDMCRDLLIEITDYCSADTRIGGMDQDGSAIAMGYWAGGRLEARPLSSMGGNYCYPCNSPGDPIGTTAALWVNKHGKRYCNEGFGDIVLAAMAGAKEPDGMIYTVFHEGIREDITYQAPGHMAVDYANNEDAGLDDIMKGAIEAGDAGFEVQNMGVTTVYAGKDAAELGKRLGFTGADLDQFIATVDRYNEICDAGVDDDFGKEPSLLRRLEGTLFAYGGQKTFGSMLVTTGGLLTDDNQQVLGEDFEPIPGLFACGNSCGGRFGMQYTTSIPGESLGIANTLGMVLGTYVANL